MEVDLSLLRCMGHKELLSQCAGVNYKSLFLKSVNKSNSSLTTGFLMIVSAEI